MKRRTTTNNDTERQEWDELRRQGLSAAERVKPPPAIQDDELKVVAWTQGATSVDDRLSGAVLAAHDAGFTWRQIAAVLGEGSSKEAGARVRSRYWQKQFRQRIGKGDE